MKLIIASLLLLLSFSSLSQTRYIKTPTGYLMVLRQGDSLLNEIEKLATQEKIPSASFLGMGFVDVKFGFFNNETKQFDPKTFTGVELTSMQGTIAWKDNQPSIHVHGVAGDKNFDSFSGHILDAQVSTGSLEITVIVHKKKLSRKKDEKISADVLQLEDF